MKRLLIANRGEIALRILRACRELNIETVAAYTQADHALTHLRLADQIVCIGRHSYVDADQILAAALSRQCDSVHPGYGFLSENAEFAAKVQVQGLTFIGPEPAHIEMMADKARARRVMNEQGVPVLPGSEQALTTVEEAIHLAEQIGYPVMLKASHGGGGRGIVVAKSENELRQGFETSSAQSEVLFGDRALYLEKFLVDPRHIEIQIFGDGNGDVVHLGARECSIQRFHQKLIEEAPPPGLAPQQIEQLAVRSCKALQSIGYTNAGTLEYLFLDGSFYFIEMNTRIQVEHPITECLTGIDLVKLQLSFAGTGLMGLSQENIQQKGHAIECRINAEDEQFVPSPGMISRIRIPGGPGVRVDTHIYEGYEVPHQYDSLLAKLIAFGASREEAISRMSGALSELEIAPIPTNIEMHNRILADERFLGGQYTTQTISATGS